MRVSFNLAEGRSCIFWRMQIEGRGLWEKKQEQNQFLVSVWSSGERKTRRGENWWISVTSELLSPLSCCEGGKTGVQTDPDSFMADQGSLIIKNPARSLWSIITGHLCFSSNMQDDLLMDKSKAQPHQHQEPSNTEPPSTPDPLRASGPGRAEPRRSQRAGRHGVSGVTGFGFPSGFLSLAVVRQHLVHQHRRRRLFPRDSVGKRDDAFSKLSPSRQPGVRR